MRSGSAEGEVMVGGHSEAAFETVIEAHLLCNGYVCVYGDGFDRERAIFPETVLRFIRETQPGEWAKLEALHGTRTGNRSSRTCGKWMDTNGSLATLRHGFKCYGRTLRVAFFKAALIATAVTGRVNVNGSEVGV